MLATPELRAAVLCDPHAERALRMLDRLDVAFVGIGPADFHGPLHEGDNFFSADQLTQVRAAGAVGQLDQRFIDARGDALPTPLDELVVAITLEQLHRRHQRRRRRRHDQVGAAARRAVAAGRTSSSPTQARYLISHAD